MGSCLSVSAAKTSVEFVMEQLMKITLHVWISLMGVLSFRNSFISMVEDLTAMKSYLLARTNSSNVFCHCTAAEILHFC